MNPSDIVNVIVLGLVVILLYGFLCQSASSREDCDGPCCYGEPFYDAAARVDGALELATYYHEPEMSAEERAWLIDQMVRALTGCTRLRALSGVDDRLLMGYVADSEEYQGTIEGYQHGDAGANSYVWDTGTEPLEV